MIETVILAGGKSERFKQNKMAVLLDNKPILQHTIESYLNVSNSITIVTGCYDVDYLKDFIQKHKIKVIHNKDYELGMFSSVLKGVSSVTGDLLLTPGDYPLVQDQTIKKLLHATGDIRVPVCDNRRGHPIYISNNLVKKIKQEPITSNLKVFRDRHNVNYIEVDDKGIYHDIDNEEDFIKMKERIK